MTSSRCRVCDSRWHLASRRMKSSGCCWSMNQVSYEGSVAILEHEPMTLMLTPTSFASYSSTRIGDSTHYLHRCTHDSIKLAKRTSSGTRVSFDVTAQSNFAAVCRRWPLVLRDSRGSLPP